MGDSAVGGYKGVVDERWAELGKDTKSDRKGGKARDNKPRTESSRSTGNSASKAKGKAPAALESWEDAAEPPASMDCDGDHPAGELVKGKDKDDENEEGT